MNYFSHRTISFSKDLILKSLPLLKVEDFDHFQNIIDDLFLLINLAKTEFFPKNPVYMFLKSDEYLCSAMQIILYRFCFLKSRLAINKVGSIIFENTELSFWKLLEKIQQLSADEEELKIYLISLLINGTRSFLEDDDFID